MYNFISLILVLSLVSFLFYFLYKQNQRAKEIHKKYIETLDVVCQTLPLLYSINGSLSNFVAKYIHDNKYN